MNIEPTPSVNQMTQTESIKDADEVNKIEHQSTIDSVLDAETKQTLDEATGLIQTIVSDKLSDKVIRKMPSDEYLHLLSLLDEIISGSIDKHV
ncbi:hypothetical protein [Legionella bononiensis]|uniref:FlaG protein n=1 Tax=Legionella bononiensis TaxID=2793102 RepID=A0ABS1WBJ8_9GAMM|nr:hypothetical protein [Legionella bononiensis]MBL7481022.1 hypothetical protein [Legionella bononiensis]MBL7526730.1 hypothetical protein [Legionella bononiensis]MBL7564137.1 hypothetical protein [Legionella bononiensis]